MISAKQCLEYNVRNDPRAKDNIYYFLHFVLAHGQHFQKHPNQHQYFSSLKTMGMCFWNALELIMECEHEKLMYAEGYAYTQDDSMLFHHGWAVTPNGECVDPTWSHGIDYFGVVFDGRYAAEIVLRQKKFAGVIDNEDDGWPLLTGKATNWRPKVMPITNPPSPMPPAPSPS